MACGCQTTAEAADRQAHRETEGAAYLRGVDAVHSALTRAVVLRQSLDGEGLAKTLAELRAGFGATLDIDALSQEAETLIRARDRTPTKVEARRALRRLGQQIANRSAIVLNSELASYYLGDIFASKLADLREQFTELRRMGGGAQRGGWSTPSASMAHCSAAASKICCRA